MNCSAKTAKGKQCSFKATIGNFCKKHEKNNATMKSKSRSISCDIVYHNHAPNVKSKNCPVCNKNIT